MKSSSWTLLVWGFFAACIFFNDDQVLVRAFQPSPLLASPSSKSSSSFSKDPTTTATTTMTLENNNNNNGDDDGTVGATTISRRSALTTAFFTTMAATTTIIPSDAANAVPQSNGLPLTTASSGLRWADAKVGTGEPLKKGQIASIDYSMASTAGRFPQIYTTKDKGTPYRWTIGDGTTIAGIEQAIVGGDGIPPMQPGGIRRVIIPANLGYEKLAKANSNAVCLAGEPGSINPIPPKNLDSGAYQRWYQFYCNPRIPYQPDLVFDIKLYGKRTTTQ